MVKQKLKKLLVQYPLSDEWSRPEIYSEEFKFNELTLNLVGLSTFNKNDTLVTSSATAIRSFPIERAFFELIERTSIIEAENKKNSIFQSYKKNGQMVASKTHKEVFLSESNPEVSQYSKSNGVAVQLTQEKAIQNSLNELVERDKIIRSWFGENKPLKIIPIFNYYEKIKKELNKDYTISSYIFKSPLTEQTTYLDKINVVGTFGFPKDENRPLLLGFGASENLQMAITHSLDECLQRLGFLWDESISPVLPEFSPSALYHQEYFLRKEGIEKIKKWLKGQHAHGQFNKSIFQEDNDLVTFIDITPEHLTDKLKVMKAQSGHHVPLIFGKGYADFFPESAENLFIHPIT